MEAQVLGHRSEFGPPWRGGPRVRQVPPAACRLRPSRTAGPTRARPAPGTGASLRARPRRGGWRIVIDSHVHLWDRSALRYPWLDARTADDRLPAAATPAALLAALPQPLDGIVHIEANPADGFDEIRWLTGATAALPCPVALVAHVPMMAPDVREQLEAQAAQPGVVGIRDIAVWHPDPARRRISDPNRLDSAAFRAAMGAVAGLGLAFELMISFFQAEAAARLARLVPDLRLVLNHCGGPPDDSVEGRALWRDGLERLAEQPNVAIKLCDPAAFKAGASRSWMLDVLAICLDIFGPARALYGSNWPVAATPPRQWAAAVAEALAGLSPASQERVWSGTAQAIYFDGPHPPLPARGGVPA